MNSLLFGWATRGFFLAHQIWISVVLPIWDISISSHIPVPARGKDKEWTAAWWLQVDPWLHCSVKMASPCRISANSGFSGKLFHVLFFPIWNAVLSVSKKKNTLFVWGWDRKIHPSWSPFVITQQASWCQSVTDFSIPPSHSWWILIFYQKGSRFWWLKVKASSSNRINRVSLRKFFVIKANESTN